MEIFELVFSLAQSTLRFTPILIFAAMAGVFSAVSYTHLTLPTSYAV